jgi:hypothetical protein
MILKKIQLQVGMKIVCYLKEELLEKGCANKKSIIPYYQLK